MRSLLTTLALLCTCSILTADPGPGDIFRITYAAQGQLQKAIVAWENTVRLDPNNSRAVDRIRRARQEIKASM